MSNLSLTIDLLPESTRKLSIKLGSSRTKLTNVATIEPLPSEEEILDTLEQYGYGTEYPYARLMWYDDKRHCVKSLSMHEPIEDDEQKAIVSVLTSCIIDLVAENRRTLNTQNEVMIKREQTIENILDKFMRSQEEVISERSTALALDLSLQQLEQDGQESYKERGVQAILQLAETYMQTKLGANIDPSTIKTEQFVEYVKNNSEMKESLIDAFLDDEEVVQMISKKLVSRSLGENNKS
jgi:hypothetical protein